MHPERLHQCHRGGHVIQHVRGDGARGRFALGHRGSLHHPVTLGGELEALLDQVVEPLVALEQRVHGRQERSRLRALDDAVIVGAGDRHDLADPELAEPLLGHRGELHRVADRADRDDAALAGHEPRHRGDRAEAARVGEGHGGAGEVVGHEAVVARLVHRGLVGRVERGEVHGLGALDDGDDEPPAPVLPLHVYRETQPDSLGLYPIGRAVLLDQGVPHHRVQLGGLHQRPSDEMSEGDLLASPRGLERAVEPASPLFQHPDRHHTERGGRRDREALLHVGDELGGGPFDRAGACGEAGRSGGRTVGRSLPTARAAPKRRRGTLGARQRSA